jgi:flagellar biosynthesis/type III secretory pathway M-ring protein FliF/YscJ
MPDDEKEPDIERTPKDVIVDAPTAEAIAEALPPTISIEDRKTIAELTLEILKQHDEETRKAFEEERRKREKEHEEVVKAFEEEREDREKEHSEAVKWRRRSFAFAVISCFLAFVSIYLGYLALLVR